MRQPLLFYAPKTGPYMKLFLLVLISFFNYVYLYSQSNLIRPKKENLPAEFASLIKTTIHSSYTIDFTGDGNKDYIVSTSDHNKKYHFIWVSHEKEIIKKEENYLAETDYSWFINLDKDPEPEIIKAHGYEDGIDYYVIDQNLNSGVDSILFYFHPVISFKENYYVGYPAILKQMKIQFQKEVIQMKVSLNHNVERGGLINRPADQKQLPVLIFLSSRPGYDIINSQMIEVEWKTLKALQTEVFY